MIGKKEKHEERVLDVDASMQGSLSFKDPVNLRINGRFEGILNTKGNLTIGEHASVNADIAGESIVIAGRLTGKVTALKELRLVAPAKVIGDISAPILSVAEGAIFDGTCRMLETTKTVDATPSAATMTPEELAKYLEVEVGVIDEWVNAGKIPVMKEESGWKFDRVRIDEWVAKGKIK